MFPYRSNLIDRTIKHWEMIEHFFDGFSITHHPQHSPGFETTMCKLVVQNCATSMVAHWSRQNYFQTLKFFYCIHSLTRQIKLKTGKLNKGKNILTSYADFILITFSIHWQIIQIKDKERYNKSNRPATVQNSKCVVERNEMWNVSRW